MAELSDNYSHYAATDERTPTGTMPKLKSPSERKAEAAAKKAAKAVAPPCIHDAGTPAIIYHVVRSPLLISTVLCCAAEPRGVCARASNLNKCNCPIKGCVDNPNYYVLSYVHAPLECPHQVQVSVWEAARAAGGDYFPPTYEQDGFIHATHDGHLLVDVLNHFYKEVEGTFLCLALDIAALASPVKMESPAPVGDKSAEGGPAPEQFPHIYGPISPLSCVVGEYPVARAEDGTFLKVEGLA